jgi:hypothetical protein
LIDDDDDRAVYCSFQKQTSYTLRILLISRVKAVDYHIRSLFLKRTVNSMITHHISIFRVNAIKPVGQP